MSDANLRSDILRALKFLSLPEADRIKDDAALWVLNATNPKGNVNIQTSDGQGGFTVVKFPVSTVPVDASMMAPRQNILGVPNFRRLVAGKFLLIVESESMEKLLATNRAARDEVQRIVTLNSGGGEDSGIGVADVSVEEIISISDDISGAAIGVVTQTDLSESQAIAILQGQEDVLSDADLKYIVDNSQQARVKEYAAQVLQKR